MSIQSRIELFSKFIEENPTWETDAGISQPNDSTYKSIPRSKYQNTINVKTGEIFKGDDRLNILFKHCKLLFLRPVHLTIKTLWHLSVIGPLVLELKKLIKEEQTKEQCAENILNSFCDIIRTPLYGVAMLAVHVGGIFSGIFCPNSLYYTRDLVGKLERDLLRVDCLSLGYPSLSPYNSCSPCFSPIDHLMKVRGPAAKETAGIYTTINKYLEESEKIAWDWKEQGTPQ